MIWLKHTCLIQTFCAGSRAYSVMCAYNRLRGEPCCGDKYLEDLLRNKWGFKGYIVWIAVLSAIFTGNAHHIVNTPAASAKAVQAEPSELR